MKNKLEIKSLNIDELNTINFLIEEFVKVHKRFNYKKNYIMHFHNWIKENISKDNFILYVVKYNDKIVGFCIGVIQDNSPIIYQNKIGYVPIFVISQKFRRKGIGKILWNNIKEWFVKKNIEEIELYTEVKNEMAKKYWSNLGFKVILERRKKTIK